MTIYDAPIEITIDARSVIPVEGLPGCFEYESFIPEGILVFRFRINPLRVTWAILHDTSWGFLRGVKPEELRITMYTPLKMEQTGVK